MILVLEQQSHKPHEEHYPVFMSIKQREQLIRNKFARAVQYSQSLKETHAQIDLDCTSNSRS